MVPDTTSLPETVTTFSRRLIENVERVIVGKHEQIELLVVALLCQGHVLIEDVPGTGKTMLARAIAVSMGMEFGRLQCTPDLLPNDITGVDIYNQKTNAFEFQRGPVFVNILLTDEINRATPRTQAALLEAMQEGQVTTGNTTRKLPRPFLVLATQNPIEYQLDRFLMRISLGYPEESDEIAILRNLRKQHPIETLAQVVDGSALLRLHDTITDVHVDGTVEHYILAIVRATREHADISLGASPRGSLALYKTAQAWAALHDRDYTIPDDIKRLAPMTLAHRLILRPESQLRGRTADGLVREILERAELKLSNNGG